MITIRFMSEGSSATVEHHPHVEGVTGSSGLERASRTPVEGRRKSRLSGNMMGVGGSNPSPPTITKGRRLLLWRYPAGLPECPYIMRWVLLPLMRLFPSDIMVCIYRKR